MSSPYELFGTSSEREQQGIVVDYGTFQFKLARAGGANRRYLKALEVKTKPIRRALAANAANPEQVASIMRDVFAETVVLGWEGVVDRDGDSIPFSKEACVALFKDLPDLFADVQNQASNFQQFLDIETEADEGN
jgi:hypothetical protein